MRASASVWFDDSLTLVYHDRAGSEYQIAYEIIVSQFVLELVFVHRVLVDRHDELLKNFELYFAEQFDDGLVDDYHFGVLVHKDAFHSVEEMLLHLA